MKSIILAGGLGTRLGNVDVPKSLMTFNEKTILEQNTQSLPSGSEYIYILGNKSDQIIKFLNKNKITDDYLVETEPEGTGGWLRHVKKSGKDRLLNDIPLTENFIVCNGDNLIEVPWIDVLIQHLETKAFVTIVTTRIEDAFDSGTVTVDKKNKITSFKEKVGKHEVGYINSGFYYFSKKGLDYITKTFDSPKFGKIMLERDIFPELIKTGKVFSYKHIGKWAATDTKARIKQAEKVFKNEN